MTSGHPPWFQVEVLSSFTTENFQTGVGKIWELTSDRACQIMHLDWWFLLPSHERKNKVAFLFSLQPIFNRVLFIHLLLLNFPLTFSVPICALLLWGVGWGLALATLLAQDHTAWTATKQTLSVPQICLGKSQACHALDRVTDQIKHSGFSTSIRLPLDCLRSSWEA